MGKLVQSLVETGATAQPQDNTINGLVIILAPSGRDAEGAAAMLQRDRITSKIVHQVNDLIKEVDENIGALLVAEEALTDETFHHLSTRLKQQSAWSDIPLLMLTRSVPVVKMSRQISSIRLAQAFTNVIFLERPLQGVTLVSAVKMALKARQRQFQIRDYLLEKEQSAQALKEAKVSAETANLRKSQFLASMSHELRTPLNAVIGYSEMLQNGMGGNLNEKQDKYINNVISSGKHLLKMVNEILDLAKVESGKVVISTEKIDLQALMNEEMETFRPLVKQKNIQLSYTIDPSIVYLVADPLRIRQILLNLISNAIKFNHEKGVVTITWYANEQDWVTCEVTDTGIGIPEDKISELFTEFYQVDNTFARQQEGTGLGLAVTKRLVELQGGSINVKSEVGQGSVFTFKLPRNPVDKEPS